MRRRLLFIACTTLAAALVAAPRAQAAKLIGASVLDKDYLVVQISDGDVAHEQPGEKVTRYAPELSTTAAAATASLTIKSSADTSYGTAGKNPTACARKTKMSGQSQGAWGTNDYAYEYTYQHWIRGDEL